MIEEKRDADACPPDGQHALLALLASLRAMQIAHERPARWKNVAWMGVALVLMCLLGQFSNFLRHAQVEMEVAGRQKDVVLHSTVQTLGEVRSAARLMRESAEQQRGYYRDTASAIKATSKAAFIATRNLARLIEHLDRNANTFGINADSRMEDLTQAGTRAVGQFGDAAERIAAQSDSVGYQAKLALGAARGSFENLERLSANPALARSAANLERSSANLEKTTALAAEAAGHLRDRLKPSRRGFWITVVKIALTPIVWLFAK